MANLPDTIKETMKFPHFESDLRKFRESSSGRKLAAESAQTAILHAQQEPRLSIAASTDSNPSDDNRNSNSDTRSSSPERRDRRATTTPSSSRSKCAIM